jgi:hypothetical protein
VAYAVIDGNGVFMHVRDLSAVRWLERRQFKPAEGWARQSPETVETLFVGF